MQWLVMVVGIAIAACGPSNAEIKTAKSAHYAATPQTLFDIAMEVAQRDYKIGDVDVEHARFATAPQFYNAEGGRQSPGAGGYVQMGGGSIELTLVVEVLPADQGQVIAITPKAFQVVSGSPKPRELAPDDPALPGWVHGRVDSLAVAIYDAAKQHAVQ